jgi:Cof subfamily protein (haloacid dehalogenase superfamily)
MDDQRHKTAAAGRIPPAMKPKMHETPTIKLVAIDLDGTLLDSNKKVSEQTVRGLQCLMGAKVVIASARPPRSVRHIYRQLGLDTWQINYNGALIWDEVGQQPIFHRPMKASLAHQMVEVARDMFDEVLIHAEIMDKWYTDRDDTSHTTETGKLFKPDSICAIEEFCAHPVTKLMMLGDPPILTRIEALLLEEFGEHVSILHTDRDLLQIMDKRVSKAVALQKVATHYGIRAEEVMAVGDAPNDVGMLQYAGVAVAMDNAHDMVKKIADWIAPSIDDHGVHAALVRYGLCKI